MEEVSLAVPLLKKMRTFAAGDKLGFLIVSEMDQGVQQNASTSEELAAQAAELSGMVDQLRKIVGGHAAGKNDSAVNDESPIDQEEATEQESRILPNP
jgi:uncharacterized phage infection (PIP) family protein YhgE